MSAAKDPLAKLQENSLVADLISRGAESAKILRGFVGPSRDAKFITLYQSLARLGDTVEIARDDVLYVVDAPGSSLGAVILWIREGANLAVRRTDTEASPTEGPGSRPEVAKGRLRMRVKQSWGGGVCTSVCEPCISWCDCSICQTLPE